MSKKRFRAVYIGAGKFYPGVPSRNLTPDEVERRISDKMMAMLKREKVFRFVEVKPTKEKQDNDG